MSWDKRKKIYKASEYSDGTNPNVVRAISKDENRNSLASMIIGSLLAIGALVFLLVFDIKSVGQFDLSKEIFSYKGPVTGVVWIIAGLIIWMGRRNLRNK